MQIDFDAPSKIRQETYLDYEFRADIGDVKILFNDPTQTYDHLVAVEQDEKLLKFKLLNAAPATSFIGDDYVVYPDVLPNVDLCYDLESGKLKETLVINSAEAQKEFTFSLTAENVTGELQADSSIVYTDGEGKQVWKIEAPYATDANGNNVETMLSFNGDTYTMGILPAEDAVYPIRLDPTVKINGSPTAVNSVFYALSTTAAYSPSAYCFPVAHQDGANLISSLTIYCRREFNSVLYTNNAGRSKAYYRFLKSDGTALTSMTDIVVADTTNWLATITVPDEAYTIEFTGSKPYSASGNTLILMLKSAETTDSSSNWKFLQSDMTYNAAGSYSCQIPANGFTQSASTTVAVSATYDAPMGATFTPGSYTVSNYRDDYGYMKLCYVDQYNAAGTLISSTNIPHPSSKGTKTTALTVGAGIVQIILRGSSLRGSSSDTFSRVTFSITSTAPEYGTAKTSITLAASVSDLTIIPGFAPAFPANGYKTYVAYGADANYSLADKVTASSGTTVYIKTTFNADESLVSTKFTGLCLYDAPTGTPVIVYSDIARSVNKSANCLTDTARATHATQTIATDSKRTIQTADNITTDTSRRVIELLGEDTVLTDASRIVAVQSEVIADTKRPANVSATPIADTFRRKVASGICRADTKRQAAIGPATSYNSIDCGGVSLWNSDTDGIGEYGPHFLNVGNDDGTRRIKNMTVYCYRKRGTTTTYLNNTASYLNAYYWFLDKNGKQISSTTTIVVDPVYYLATIPVPADAYTIAFKGQSVSDDICRLRIDYVSIINLATHFVVTPVPMNYCQEAVHCVVPNAAFTGASDGKSVSNIYDAPFGTTFTPGTVAVTANRGMYSYMQYGRVILYNGQGTAVSTTVIGYPDTAATAARTYTSILVYVTIPDGITRIEVKGKTYSTNSLVSEFPTINFYAPVSTPEYGTAKYYTRLSRKLCNAKISPGFKKCPAHPYKTYVAIGEDITDNYVEASTLTAPSNARVWVKVCFTANESAIVNQCDNFCFMLPSRIEEDVDVDTRRFLPAWFGNIINDTTRTAVSSQDLSIDAKRSVIAIGDFIADTQRSVGKWISGNINVDTIRNVIKSIAPTTDSKRQLLNSEDVSTDSRRPVVINEAVTNDTKRRTSKTADFASDAKRVLRNSTEILADTFRKAVSRFTEITDTKRRTTQTVTTVNDTTRKTAINEEHGYDTKRSAAKSILLALDAKRNVHVSVSINADTFRSVGEKIEAVAAIDTIRKILNSDSVKNDLLRRVLREESIGADVNRRVNAKNSTESDLKRKTGISQENASDTTRKTAITAQSNSDTARKTKALTFGKFDAIRKVAYYISIASDTDRKISNLEVYRISVDTKRIVTDTEWPCAEHYEFDVVLLDNEITFTTILAGGVETQ